MTFSHNFVMNIVTSWATMMVKQILETRKVNDVYMYMYIWMVYLFTFEKF